MHRVGRAARGVTMHRECRGADTDALVDQVPALPDREPMPSWRDSWRARSSAPGTTRTCDLRFRNRLEAVRLMLTRVVSCPSTRDDAVWRCVSICLMTPDPAPSVTSALPSGGDSWPSQSRDGVAQTSFPPVRATNRRGRRRPASVLTVEAIAVTDANNGELRAPGVCARECAGLMFGRVLWSSYDVRPARGAAPSAPPVRATRDRAAEPGECAHHGCARRLGQHRCRAAGGCRIRGHLTSSQSCASTAGALPSGDSEEQGPAEGRENRSGECADLGVVLQSPVSRRRDR